MELRSTPEFSCQAWTTSLVSLLACGVGLAQVGISSWLWIYSENFVLVLGDSMRNVFGGYMFIGLLAFIACMIGIVSALLRNRTGLLIFIVLMLASIACQAGVWAFIYLEQQKISQLFEDRIQFYIQYYEFFNSEFNCNLQAGVQSPENEQSCGEFVSNWMWKVVWAMLGLCAGLICLQVSLLVMAAMLHQLVREELHRNRVQFDNVQHPAVDDTESENISTGYEPSAPGPLPPEAAFSAPNSQSLETHYEPTAGLPMPPLAPSPETDKRDTVSQHSKRKNSQSHALELKAVIHNTTNITLDPNASDLAKSTASSSPKPQAMSTNRNSTRSHSSDHKDAAHNSISITRRKSTIEL